MEYLDILDKKTGLKTGNICDRSMAHQKGYWHKVAHIWVFNKNGNLLIQKRANTKESNPDMWTLSCAGHVSSGSTSLEAAVNELREELGLIVDAEKLTFIFSYKREKITKDYKSRHILDVFLIMQDIDLNVLRLQEEEVSEVRLISIDEYRSKINKKDPKFIDYSYEFNHVLTKL